MRARRSAHGRDVGGAAPPRLRRRALLAGGLSVLAPSACKTRPLELWLGGDVHLGATGAARPLEPLAALLGDALGVVNLEGPLRAPEEARAQASARGDGERVVLANAVDRLGALRAGGVVALGVANNHARDFGEAGEAATVAAARAAGFGAVGGSAGACPLERRDLAPAVVLGSWDLSEPGPPLPRLASELEQAAARGVLVALFHVTGPPSYLPARALRDAVELALSLGARVVAAHGAHALGPVERRGRQVIAWGLGNLLFSCDCTRELDGLVLRVRFEGDETLVTVIPIDAGLGGEAARPSHDAKLLFELLASIGSSPLAVDGVVARL